LVAGSGVEPVGDRRAHIHFDIAVEEMSVLAADRQSRVRAEPRHQDVAAMASSTLATLAVDTNDG
jgi:hypothetical protein